MNKNIEDGRGGVCSWVQWLTGRDVVKGPGQVSGLQLGVRAGEENKGQTWVVSAICRFQAGPSVHGWAWLCGARGQAGQGWGKAGDQPSCGTSGAG